MPFLEPFICFKGKKLTSFGKPPNPHSRVLSDQEKLLINRTDKPYSLFSNKSRGRLMKALTTYCETITLARSILKFKHVKPLSKHTFITLTLSSQQRHCDKTITRELLNHFIIQLKREYGAKHYFWKAELQSNGNIHYHVLTEVYIPHEELRTNWNEIQDKLGYVQFAKNWREGYNPNSTDVHALKNVRDVTAYVAKYMSKDEAARPLCGHTWGKSQSIERLQPLTLYDSAELSEWFQIQRDSINHKVYNHEWSCTYVMSQRPNYQSLPENAKKNLKNILISNVEALCLSI